MSFHRVLTNQIIRALLAQFWRAFYGSTCFDLNRSYIYKGYYDYGSSTNINTLLSLIKPFMLLSMLNPNLVYIIRNDT